MMKQATEHNRERRSVLTKGQRTKQHLFETSIALINERGYDNVTVTDICEAACVAKGTFYVHYAAKDDIIRESYYSDMTAFMEERYLVYVEEHPDASVREKIRAFLLLELSFSEHTGLEVTSRAFSANFAACSPGSSKHLERRVFAETLKSLIVEAQLPDADEAFLALETLVRGCMASWCFAGGSFDIVSVGARFIDVYLNQQFRSSIGV